MKWLTNMGEGERKEQMRLDPAWLMTKMIGKPKATNSYSSEELARMGMVGVYEPERARFTGPIPEPEAKPAPQAGAEYFPRVADPETRRDSSENVQVLSETSEGKPAPSEDEGEKWGRLLWRAARQGENMPITEWEELAVGRKRRWNEAALRFRAECVALFKEALRAARAYLEILAGDGTDGDGAEEHQHLADALSALPDQGEPVEEKPRLHVDDPRAADLREKLKGKP